MCWTLGGGGQGEEAGILEAHLCDMTGLLETIMLHDSPGVEKPKISFMVSTLNLDPNNELLLFFSLVLLLLGLRSGAHFMIKSTAFPQTHILPLRTVNH